jgi:hypothetical protein
MEVWSVQAHWEAELANQREMADSEAAALVHSNAQLRNSLLQEVEVALHSQTDAAQQFQAECQKELASELRMALDQIHKASSSAASHDRVDSRCEASSSPEEKALVAALELADRYDDNPDEFDRNHMEFYNSLNGGQPGSPSAQNCAASRIAQRHLWPTGQSATAGAGG